VAATLGPAPHRARDALPHGHRRGDPPEVQTRPPQEGENLVDPSVEPAGERPPGPGGHLVGEAFDDRVLVHLRGQPAEGPHDVGAGDTPEVLAVLSQPRPQLSLAGQGRANSSTFSGRRTHVVPADPYAGVGRSALVRRTRGSPSCALPRSTSRERRPPSVLIDRRSVLTRRLPCGRGDDAGAEPRPADVRQYATVGPPLTNTTVTCVACEKTRDTQEAHPPRLCPPVGTAPR